MFFFYIDNLLHNMQANNDEKDDYMISIILWYYMNIFFGKRSNNKWEYVQGNNKYNITS